MVTPPPQRKDHPKDTGFGAKTDDSEGPIEPESVGGVKTVRVLVETTLAGSLGSRCCLLTDERGRFRTYDAQVQNF